MSFISKISKLISLSLAIGGAILTTTGVALLGVGTNYTMTIDTNKISNNVSGSNTLTKSSHSIDEAAGYTMGVGSSNYGIYYDVFFVDGTKMSSYELKEVNDKYKSNKPSYSDFIKVMNLNKKATEKSIKESKEYLNNLPASERDKYSKSIKSYEEIASQYGRAQQGYDMMVSGAVLLPVFAIVMIFGTATSILNKKDKKESK